MNTENNRQPPVALTPMTCHVTTQGFLNACYVTLELSDTDKLETTKRFLRFGNASEAAEFLASLEAAAACGQQTLQECNVTVPTGQVVASASDGRAASESSNAGPPPASSTYRPVSVDDHDLPASLCVEAGRDEGGFFAIVYVDDNYNGNVTRGMSFSSEAALLRFLDDVEGAALIAARQLRSS